MNIVYISWAPYCSRSDNTARELGGKSYMVYYSLLGSNYFTIALKYLLQTVKTLSILIKDRPDVVFVMNPSVVATVPVYFYCKVFSRKYIIDAHTGVLTDQSKFRKLRFLQKFFSKRALFTIVTNKSVAQRLIEWETRYILVPDVPVQWETPVRPSLPSQISNITLVNSFASDEPLQEFLEAAEKLDGVNCYITGKLTRKTNSLIEKVPSNVKFTDFLLNDAFYGLLLASDLIVVLTTRDNTMQRGAYEAIYFGKPVVTSDWPVLRKNFPQGTIFVDNSPQGIFKGIHDALNNLEQLTEDACVLREKKLLIWQSNKSKILDEIANCKV